MISVCRQRRTAALGISVRWLIWAIVRWRLRSWNAWITASPRAREVMKSGSPVNAWIRLAGEATIGGANAGELGRDASGLADSLDGVWSLIAHLKKIASLCDYRTNGR
ncbi:hypothetical protein D3C76_1405860 [compost metagenome]